MACLPSSCLDMGAALWDIVPPPLLFASLGSSLQRPQCQEAYMACKLQHPGGGNVFTKALGRSQDLGSRV